MQSRADIDISTADIRIGTVDIRLGTAVKIQELNVTLLFHDVVKSLQIVFLCRPIPSALVARITAFKAWGAS